MNKLLACTGTLFFAFSATAAENCWLGGDPMAAASWSDGVPTADDVILLTADHVDALVWTNALTATVAGWVQDEGYTGTVTFQTSPAANAAMESFTITGDAVLNGGKWTHWDNVKEGNSKTAQTAWLKVSVGGNLETGAGFSIDVTGKGYSTYITAKGGAALAGPEPGGTTGTPGASHGGQGGLKSALASGQCAGMYDNPTMLGSAAGKASAFKKGGGAVVLSVGGTFVHNGSVLANGAKGGAAGGSVNVTACQFIGGGQICVCGGTHDTANYAGGGGGRIAVHLTDPEFDREVFAERWAGRFSADGGANSNFKTSDSVYMGGAGTVYIEFAGDEGRGDLIIDSSQVKLQKCVGVAGAAVVESGVVMNLRSLAVNTRGILGIKAGGVVSLPTFGAVTTDGGEYAAIRLLNGGKLTSELPHDKLNIASYTLESYGVNVLEALVNLDEGGQLKVAAQSDAVARHLTLDGLKVNGERLANGEHDVAELAAKYEQISGTGTIRITGKGNVFTITIR